MSDFETPGTPSTIPAATPRTTRRPTRNVLPPPLDLRRGGFFSSGSSRCADGAGHAAGAGGFRSLQEKFTVSLPFVVGQGAEVSVQGEPGSLVAEPIRDQGVFLA